MEGVAATVADVSLVTSFAEEFPLLQEEKMAPPKKIKSNFFIKKILIE